METYVPPIVRDMCACKPRFCRQHIIVSLLFKTRALLTLTWSPLLLTAKSLGFMDYEERHAHRDMANRFCERLLALKLTLQNIVDPESYVDAM